jgi:hypothetical protein
VKKLLCSVDIFGMVHFLEKFPDDEDHQGLHDMLEDANGEIESEEPAGVYLAELFIDMNLDTNPINDMAYLEVEKLTPVTVNIPQPREPLKLPKPENLEKVQKMLSDAHNKEPSDDFFLLIDRYMEENKDLLEDLAKKGD